MNAARRSRFILLGAVLLLIGSIVLLKFAPNGIVRCYLVRLSNLDQIAPGVFVDPAMPIKNRETLLTSLSQAKDRNSTLFGGYTANPTIIAGHTMDVMQTYGGNSYNRVGRTYLTLVASFVILGPDGIRSIDVLAHELAHAELSERIGHRNRSEIPNWFDEGLAVQFDDRISVDTWRVLTDDGRTAPDLDQLGIIKHNDRLGYATAKHEVARWLDIVGKEGLLELIQAMRNGDNFQETYKSIEQAYSTMN